METDEKTSNPAISLPQKLTQLVLHNSKQLKYSLESHLAVPWRASDITHITITIPMSNMTT